jgi:hypothetical protein
LDEYEITGVINGKNGMISHCAVKGYGIQPIAIMEKLIREEPCSFFIYDKENKLNVYARTSPNGTTYLTTNPHGSGRNMLNFLPVFYKPKLRQLIESIR